MVEANDDIGGHAAVCTGNIPLGGGTAAQKAAGIVDSPEILFKDLCDWSSVGNNGAAEYRYNDRDLVRAFADNNVMAYDFLVAHGLVWTKPVPDRGGMTQALAATRTPVMFTTASVPTTNVTMHTRGNPEPAPGNNRSR